MLQDQLFLHLQSVGHLINGLIQLKSLSQKLPDDLFSTNLIDWDLDEFWKTCIGHERYRDSVVNLQFNRHIAF